MSGGERPKGFVPGRFPIDTYGNGGFRFADMSHKGSILALPSGIYAWPVTSAADLTPQSFDAIRREAVGQAASRIAALAPVRASLLELQRRAQRPPGLVADGRSTP